MVTGEGEEEEKEEEERITVRAFYTRAQRSANAVAKVDAKAFPRATEIVRLPRESILVFRPCSRCAYVCVCVCVSNVSPRAAPRNW